MRINALVTGLRKKFFPLKYIAIKISGTFGKFATSKFENKVTTALHLILFRGGGTKHHSAQISLNKFFNLLSHFPVNSSYFF